MSGPDKPKVIGEEWSDERVKSFLAIEPYDTAKNPDFNALLKAYQAMRAGDFERFIGFFVEAGRDLNAVNENGETILDIISEHRRSVDYARALEQAGAKRTAAAGN
ncbi:PA4642 family protein [Marinobacter sp. M216]|uniref:PA4642 family protein n=1 Tax=Marinobacter albus TaxID=3030833 RepID=A0ABT7HEC4_9GAMM|nr:MULTISPECIES: PA4642 family protein [unclassified Marinobacter]MBW7471795.1 PA4642 family protein [Marinobacter sp. F4218]MDK9558364.1 PA4642 family protein [Marinobacter sp. M216]